MTPTSAFTESDLEAAAREWFAALDYAVLDGPSLAPGEPAAEREDYSDVVLVARLLHRASGGIIFTTIQKFVPDSPKTKPPSPPGRGAGGEGPPPHYRAGHHYAGLVETARDLRLRGTPVETAFWELVRDRRFLGLKFRRQHQIGVYIADFYCHEKRLVVEFDGEVHAARQKEDRARDTWMQAEGFTVLRFPNHQLLDDPELVLDRIAAVPSVPRKGKGEGERDQGGPSPLAPLPEGEGWVGGVRSGKGGTELRPPSPPGRGVGGEGPAKAKGEGLLLSDRRNIVVIADEAHRSQYDFIDGFARHLRDALPNASFIAFTGTPIERADRSTRAVFGDYISVYDIQQAVADKATVPIYVRGPPRPSGARRGRAPPPRSRL